MKVGYSYLLQQFDVRPGKMKVSYMDLPRGTNATDILRALREQLKVCNFTLGPEVGEFEAKFAALHGTRQAIGVNSGTDALFLTMKAVGIGPGDEVITVPNSFIATVAAIANTGARPVFVDVGDDYNIKPDLIEEAITPRTRAILPVHLTGNPADMPRIVEIAQRYGLLVIEDACQAVSASINGKPVGSFGISGCFSLHPLKNLNVWGDGGVVTTDSDELAEKLRLMRNHGLKNRDECEFFAYNSRLDTVQAIVALRLMPALEAATEARIRHARVYDEAFSQLGELIKVPPRKAQVRQVFHTYVVQAKDRDNLHEYLCSNGVEAKVHYPIPIHLQKASRYLGYKEGDFPLCEAQARSIITLPVHQHLTEIQLEYVVGKVGEFYGE